MDTAKKLTTTVMSPDGQTKTKEASVISEHTLNVIINEQPIYRKYDITKHKRYKFLSDANPRLKYDIAREISTRAVLSKEEECEIVDLGEMDA